MASTHEQIVDMIIIQWSKENRGRLFKNHNGQAYNGKKISDYFLNDERIMKLKHASKVTYGMGKGTSDLIGWEFSCSGHPLFCAVEVKTLKSPTLTKEQKYWLNNVVKIGGRAYIAKENHNGYDILEWRL